MGGNYVYRRPWTSWRRDRPKTTELSHVTPPTPIPGDITSRTQMRVGPYRDKRYTFRRPWWAWGYARTRGTYAKNIAVQLATASFGTTAAFTPLSTIRTERATQTFATTENETATTSRTRLATVPSLATTENETATVTRTERATPASFATTENLTPSVTRTERATNSFVTTENLTPSSTRTERATVPTLATTEALTVGPVTRTERPSATLATTEAETGVASRTERAATSFVESVADVNQSSPAGVRRSLGAQRVGRRPRGQKGYVFRRPWWSWGGAQYRGSFTAFVVPPTTILATVPNIAEVDGLSSPGKRTTAATSSPLATTENETTSTVITDRASKTIAETSGLTVGPVRRTERAAQTFSTTDGASEVPREGEAATSSLNVRASITGSGKRTTAATIPTMGTTENFSSPGRSIRLATVRTFATTIGYSISGASHRYSVAAMGSALRVVGVARQIFLGPGILGLRAAVVETAALIHVVYLYVTVSARGEAISGTGKRTTAGTTTLASREAISSPGTASDRATVATVATTENLASTPRSTKKPSATLAERSNASATSAVERRSSTSLLASLGTIFEAVANRVEYAAAFISSAATLVGLGKRTTAATVSPIGSKETASSPGSANFKPSATISSLEGQSASSRLNAKPSAVIGANARIPTATFRVALTASYNFVANVVVRSPGKTARSAAAVIRAALGWFGVVQQPILDVDPQRTLRLDHTRVRSLVGLRSLRKLRLDHTRRRSLP